MTGVPIAQRSIRELMDSGRFDKGKFDTILDIAVDGPDGLPSAHKGALPVEPAGRVLRAPGIHPPGHRGERSGANQWRHTLLSVTARFMVVKSANDLRWYEYNKREEVGVQYMSLFRAAYQKLCAVSRMIVKATAAEGKEAGSPAKIAALFKARAVETQTAHGWGGH